MPSPARRDGTPGRDGTWTGRCRSSRLPRRGCFSGQQPASPPRCRTPAAAARRHANDADAQRAPSSSVGTRRRGRRGGRRGGRRHYRDASCYQRTALGFWSPCMLAVGRPFQVALTHTHWVGHVTESKAWSLHRAERRGQIGQYVCFR